MKKNSKCVFLKDLTGYVQLNDSLTEFVTMIKYKGGKFLKKLWCCVGGEYDKIIWFYQLG